MRKMRSRIWLWISALVLALSIGAAVFLKDTYVIPVIMYHSFDDRANITKLSVEPESFEAQMRFLREKHYNVVGLDKIASYMEKKGRIPPRTIAVTIDDGFLNNYTCAYPVLKKYKIPATIFVVTSWVGRKGFMTWDQIREISDSGIVTIGSHSIRHLWLPSLNDRELKEELAGSKRILEAKLGRPVDYLCYPVGAYDERVKKAAKEAGYRCAVTTNPGRRESNDDIYAIKRIKISRTSDSLFVFRLETSGYYTWLKEHRDD